MALHEQYAWVASRTIDATTTTLDFPTHGRPFVLVEVLSSSSLSVKAGLMGKAGVDRKVRCFLLSGASTETQVDPDTATGTVAAQDFILVPSLGAKTVRITRAAGSGAIQGVASPSDGISAWVLMKILDGGITAATSTEYADDAAFTVGASKVGAVGFLADETATDSVDEGDIGAPRMTLARKVITASDRVDDAAFTPATDYVSVIGGQADETSPDSVDEGDAGALRITLDRFLRVMNETESGFLRVAGTQATIKFASIAATAAGDNQIVTAVASKKIRVLSYAMVATGAESVQWQDDAGANLSGVMALAANGGVVCGYNEGGWFETASGQGLDLNNVGGADVTGHLSYIEV